MNNPVTQTTEADAEALVVVPFPSVDAARRWAAEIAAAYPAEPEVIVSDGRERVMLDQSTGQVDYELCFTGGWRAVEAGSGTVVIRRSAAPADANVASLLRKAVHDH